MVLKKQTVWLLSMLAVLVVLSAYYLVQGSSGQVQVATGNMSDTSKAPQSSLATDVKTDMKGVSVETKQVAPKPEGMPVTTPSDDYFIGYKMQRDAQQEQEMGRFMEVMTNGDANPKAIAEAKKKLEELAALKDNQTQVEELVKSLGSFKDVVVIAKDDMVRVVVQAETLKKDKVVEIINVVKQHMKVPGNNIVVSYKP
ncbi:SpoIIIAH-like family protein [Aneurinibacillus thermoaerophilus]|uniref:SpoIIIAH-like family protein n=1 Tax=Aneurinibacillus thermoaerophilus TaxID=143495 RepID=A0ABX8Y8N8_ANETH|nr:SpoIIIAH-like family protein [Aneurinibacillus thermoaerophilus]MED0675600.1 SpoIIIAH-like family protein [Aneurinibacillus thermoaerophilus]MED0681289.1 SpoIIIAH-like family protein [Aneurinibacillus thermoaerophilus]MED0735501.1 SpoIIIAH-like family protein [Aneurinibacillus thermoaerophilus]MED0756615.1 SpoIIIAH-like family protein [Aneurinibacillus thermoaerophilus]MED0760665.1 SpoIIIAH-like family protein [Aneurinibacillus thermoaerophilus]